MRAAGFTRVAILGGAFDPITIAHVTVLEQVVEALGAAEGWIVPAWRRPLRGESRAGAGERVVLAQVAVDGHPGLRVVDDEARRETTSYTIDTLECLEGGDTGREFWWIVGADTARTIGRWHRAAELLERARFALVNRAGVAPLGGPEARSLGYRPGRTRLITVDSPAISSTMVRERMARGEPIDGLVGEAVARRIADMGLYQPAVGPLP